MTARKNILAIAAPAVFGALGAVLVVSGVASGAQAQWQDPEGGDTGQWQAPPQQPPAQPPQQQAPAQQGWQPPPQQPQQQQQGTWFNNQGERPPTAEEGDDGETDHDSVVRHISVGFHGIRGVPIANPQAGMMLAPLVLDAPTVGIRYWFTKSVGLDLTLGVRFQDVTLDTDTASVDVITAFGLAIHGGVPISLGAGEHYNFVIIPELSFGYGTASVPSPIAANDNDVYSGFIFTLGARAGAEIQFGFIDVPELALQGTIGIGLEFGAINADICTAGDCSTSASVSLTTLTFATSVQEEPWDIFTGNITAIYYLP